ncbi:amidohydrolase family protein [Nonomuraea sp. NPDC046570]|uniref:amidohydrolase family protein n=1 Tax=Nonomuraea sp. NPDC046570 TaxID=3155255 RepID=UPI0034085560
MSADLGEFGDAVGPFDPISRADQAKAFVEARVAEGADYLKIVIDDGSTAGMRLPVIGPDVVAALVEAAHAAGLRAIAHVIGAKDAAIALDAGIDGLAHLYTDAGPDDSLAEDLAAKVAAHGAYVVSTLAYIEVISQEERGAIPVHPQGVINALHAARTLHQAGVPLLAGTDATPFAPAHGESLHRELRLLTEAGLSAEEALAAATSLPARHFGLADRGRIAPGLRADLLLVDGDPTTDITATSAIAGIWRRGVRR